VEHLLMIKQLVFSRKNRELPIPSKKNNLKIANRTISMSYLDELNPVQRQAVTNINGPVLVVAGPGSGKTRVLTYRIAHIIESGIAPWEILALTFTNKAAKEMKERISKVVGAKANSVYAGTFHSIFARILRSEAEKIGFPSNFTIYDSDDSKSLLRSIIKELNLAKETYNENGVLQRISSAKSNLISPKGYAQNEELMQQDRQTKRPFLHKIYAEYMIRCKRSGAMDFDDLLYQLYVLLHNNPDGVREKYQKKFKYIMVDEFQDTNFLQYSIVRKLIDFPGSTQNICVVGDDAQSIYAFRGATIENILDFQKDFTNLQTFKLEQNYRSTHHIVQAANQVIGYNRKQIKKEIWTDKGDGQLIKIIKTVTDAEEARRVADLILEQKNRYHLENRQVAILYRTNAQSRGFEESLRKFNLPYRVYGGMSFYQRKEVKDLIGYLRLVVNQQDEEALKRVINYPRRGIGDATIEKLAQLASSKEQSLWTTLSEYEGTAREKTALNNFTLMIKAFIQKSANSNAKDISNYIAKQSGLMDTLKADTSIEGMGRLENVNALLDAIAEFVDNDEISDDQALQDKSLSTYLQNIALVTDADNADPNADVITLMSVHSAKGLEFQSVIVAGLEENLFPSFMSMDTPEGLDEERRLFYVAITRAERFLTLTYSASRYRFGQMKYCEPSRFLVEIDAAHLEALNPVTTKQESDRAKITGSFGRVPSRMAAAAPVIDIANFKVSPPEKIDKDMKVLHLKFGLGTVLAIEGAKDNRVATIKFKDLSEQQERKIMLKFAKLQIMED
jgi:DNA helicase II / ATP-dependent DNA helicase PcrA